MFVERLDHHLLLHVLLEGAELCRCVRVHAHHADGLNPALHGHYFRFLFCLALCEALLLRLDLAKLVMGLLNLAHEERSRALLAALLNGLHGCIAEGSNNFSWQVEHTFVVQEPLLHYVHLLFLLRRKEEIDLVVLVERR